MRIPEKNKKIKKARQIWGDASKGSLCDFPIELNQ